MSAKADVRHREKSSRTATAEAKAQGLRKLGRASAESHQGTARRRSRSA